MADVVKLVTDLGIIQPALLMNPRMRRAIRMHCAPRVKITIRLLRGSDTLDHAFELGGDSGIRFHTETERCALDRFEHVRIVEGKNCRRLVLETCFPRSTAAHRL